MAELRERSAVLALVRADFSATESSRRHGVSISTARLWSKLYQELAQVAKRHSTARPRISDREQDEALLAAVEYNWYYLVFRITLIHIVTPLQILVDDLLVYNGVLDKVSSVPKTSVKVPYRTVLFTTDKELLRRERSTQVR
ncbi:hypothetical protein ANN_12914 [Periplaneta americana]|uniref:Transposase n=1 Tax=Periplaneta americana TaxID=6978 RepID=A0ABQ8TKM0_PERAM|nr:hypothetical protein ANN_12914 [Periplaneta americana]